MLLTPETAHEPKPVALSRRLRTLVSLIDQPVIADIGCDHALLCISALQQNKATKAYACDLRKGPLQQAALNIERCGLNGSIEIRQANGLANLPADVQEIVIAGMGGKLVEDILLENPPHQSVTRLLLSPHNDVVDLRKFLVREGYEVIREVMVEDDGFYPILIVIPPHARTSKARQILSEREMLYGIHPDYSEDYQSYLVWKLEGYKKIEARLPSHRKNLYAREIFEAEALLKELCEIEK